MSLGAKYSKHYFGLGVIGRSSAEIKLSRPCIDMEHLYRLWSGRVSCYLNEVSLSLSPPSPATSEPQYETNYIYITKTTI